MEGQHGRSWHLVFFVRLLPFVQAVSHLGRPITVGAAGVLGFLCGVAQEEKLHCGLDCRLSFFSASQPRVSRTSRGVFWNGVPCDAPFMVLSSVSGAVSRPSPVPTRQFSACPVSSELVFSPPFPNLFQTQGNLAVLWTTEHESVIVTRCLDSNGDGGARGKKACQMAQTPVQATRSTYGGLQFRCHLVVAQAFHLHPLRLFDQKNPWPG